jgi:FKBP-type peptidyl-prolyl cis-trans isomerase
MILLAGLGSTLWQLPAQAQDKPAFKDEKEKASYGIGTYFGNMIKRSNMDVDLEVILGGIKDVLEGRQLKLTEAQGREAIQAYQTASQKKVAEKNKKAAEAFLAENKTKPGIQTMPVKLRDGSMAEMQYKVLTEGKGEVPKSNDWVNVKYRATLIDGKECDNTEKRGGMPARVMLSRPALLGWGAALEKMKVGSKWELYLPSSLAYGDMGNQRLNPPVEPGAALIYEMELVNAEAPPTPQPTAQAPLTSDIIKVPSAEELKKGAKIEVIKAEDAAKQAQTGSTNHLK